VVYDSPLGGVYFDVNAKADLDKHNHLNKSSVGFWAQNISDSRVDYKWFVRSGSFLILDDSDKNQEVAQEKVSEVESPLQETNVDEELANDVNFDWLKSI